MSMENPFFEGLVKIWNCIFLSMLWLAFSIPLFTTGTSTTALYYTVQKCIKSNRGYVFSCFWKSFRENFRMSLPINLILLLAAFAGITDISILDYLQENGMAGGTGQAFFKLVLCFLALYAVWVYASLARFENNWRQVMKNAMLLAAGHLPHTLLIAWILIFSVLLVYLVPVSVLIMPAVGIWLISAVTEKVFGLYKKGLE